MMNFPWLPPEPLTYQSYFVPRRNRDSEIAFQFRRFGLPTKPPKELTPMEIRWQAEDEWLYQQWRLATD